MMRMGSPMRMRMGSPIILKSLKWGLNRLGPGFSEMVLEQAGLKNQVKKENEADDVCEADVEESAEEKMRLMNVAQALFPIGPIEPHFHDV